MAEDSLKKKDVSLLDVLDAVLEKGVVLKGDLMISIADIDLVYLDLRVLVSSVETLIQAKESTSGTEMRRKINQSLEGGN